MKIRAEEPKDEQQITDLLMAAFANHPHSNQTEHLLVQALHQAKAVTLGAVAENIAGDVIGCIHFSPVKINQKATHWHIIAPLAVCPQNQKQGVGSALLAYGLKELERMKSSGCVLVGDPAYYQRFGFKTATQFSMAGVPSENLMFYAFQSAEGGEDQQKVQGEVECHPAFAVCG